MPEPKVVVAVGICACTGGIFRDTYNVLGGVDKVIPVDCYVPGCAARPEAIIDGVVKGLGVLAQKREAMLRGELPAKADQPLEEEVEEEIEEVTGAAEAAVEEATEEGGEA